MRTFDKDFKDLQLPDGELEFTSGFITALALIAGILKLLGVIV